ncbi:iron-containing alcohol dehydrogenase [Anaplasma platys]|uniref:Iron-containing alcohol dehydrogenase n=2 Tax=Anaplasma platys TaxID=949 RepID=A0A858PZ19_9RICK|nr:iron-containing alcohol dehydrogenase [Anaplasma platys]
MLLLGGGCILVASVGVFVMATEFLDMAMPAMAASGHGGVAEYVARSVHVSDKFFSNLPDVITEHPGRGFLVADSNTVRLLDSSTVQSMDHYIIQGEYNASEYLVDSIRKVSRNSDFIVALGSGSINDMCKYASFIEGKEYVSFPTAPSMNGYASPTASITMENGIKKSLPAKLPQAIYMDVGVLSNAPQRMINSGFADFICRATVKADWWISHLLLGTPYSEVPFDITDTCSRALLENYQGLVHRDRTATMVLMQALILSGIGMLIVGGSQSASQGEHIVASATELLDNHSFLHGERIGVATMCMAKLQKSICSSRPKLHATLLAADTLRKYFRECFVDEFCATLSKKSIDSEKAEHLNNTICEKWGQISDIVDTKVHDVARMKDIFKYLGAPNVPEHVGWSTEKYNRIADIAFVTRDRFTFLDLAHHARINVA